MPNFMTSLSPRPIGCLQQCIRRKRQVQHRAIPPGGRQLVSAARMVSFAVRLSRGLEAAAVSHRETMPTFTPHQDSALKAVADWMKAKPGKNGTPPVLRLFGYAGTPAACRSC